VEIVSARRKDDMVILIEQNNTLQKTLIKKVNKTFCQKLGYLDKDLENKDFFKIIDSKTREKIKNYIEYEEYGIDISSILSRIKYIKLIGNDKKEIKVKIKVFTVISNNKNNMRFELLAREPELVDVLAEFRKQNNHFEYQIDKDLKVIDARSIKSEIKLLCKFCNEHNKNCSAMLIDKKNISKEYIKEVINNIKTKIRSYDQIGATEGYIIIILINCNLKEARNVSHRIESYIPNQHKKINISYCDLQDLYKSSITHNYNTEIIQTI
jgi:G:T-mismatch repair DNA endonuclease (very short patch repair protein)